MATARTSQAHDKRVQKIADDAAAKIAADSPLEEEVHVVVEELPPGESTRTVRGRSDQVQHDTANAVAQGQSLMAEGLRRWMELAMAPFGAPATSMEDFGGLFDPRRLLAERFRLAEELLASQKQFALKVIDLFEAKTA